MVNITGNFAKEGIMNDEGINHLYFEVTPSNKIEKRNIKNNVFLFLIDNSGSMDSTYGDVRNTTSTYLNAMSSKIKKSKLDYAKESIINFLDLMSNNDKVGVISFSDNASIIQEIAPLSYKDTIISSVNNLCTVGLTNIEEPLRVAKDMLQTYKEDYNCKIILLSDGHANCGVTSKQGLGAIARDISKENISISTLGIGVDYDAHILGEIAEKGYGLFYHIKKMSEINNIFEQELSLNNSTVAITSTLKIKVPNLIEVGENLNGYAQSMEDGTVTIELGKINTKKKIVLEIKNNFVDTDLDFKYVLEYINIENKKISIEDNKTLKVFDNLQKLEEAYEHKEIVEYVLELTNQNNMMKVAENYETGNTKGLNKWFDNNLNKLTNLTSIYTSAESKAKNIETLCSSMKMNYASNSVSMEENKIMFESIFIGRK